MCTTKRTECVQVSIWVTTVENWGNITKTLRLRTDIFLVIQSICYELGITYHEPHLPVQLDPGALGDLLHTSGHGEFPLVSKGGMDVALLTLGVRQRAEKFRLPSRGTRLAGQCEGLSSRL